MPARRRSPIPVLTGRNAHRVTSLISTTPLSLRCAKLTCSFPSRYQIVQSRSCPVYPSVSAPLSILAFICNCPDSSYLASALCRTAGLDVSDVVLMRRFFHRRCCHVDINRDHASRAVMTNMACC